MAAMMFATSHKRRSRRGRRRCLSVTACNWDALLRLLLLLQLLLLTIRGRRSADDGW